MCARARHGLIGIKLGMSRIFDAEGNVVPVTLISVQDNYILGNKTKEKHGYNAVLISAIMAKRSRVKKPQIAVFNALNMPALKKTKEFRILDPDNMPDAGMKISNQHFKIGQFVDISGTTIGKGFAGGMKRHGFGGQPESHGTSITHRSLGSTGQRQDPGKVFKNKKMAGHMGCKNVTVQSLEVVDVTEDYVIVIRGCIPGPEFGIVYITDAIKKVLHIDTDV